MACRMFYFNAWLLLTSQPLHSSHQLLRDTMKDLFMHHSCQGRATQISKLCNQLCLHTRSLFEEIDIHGELLTNWQAGFETVWCVAVHVFSKRLLWSWVKSGDCRTHRVMFSAVADLLTLQCETMFWHYHKCFIQISVWALPWHSSKRHKQADRMGWSKLMGLLNGKFSFH